jgi:hypothetical protein
MEPPVQLVDTPATPLKVTVPVLDPKLVPVIVTTAPTAPVVGERLKMYGVTVKLELLLAIPLTVTITLPEEAPEGFGRSAELLDEQSDRRDRSE